MVRGTRSACGESRPRSPRFVSFCRSCIVAIIYNGRYEFLPYTPLNVVHRIHRHLRRDLITLS